MERLEKVKIQISIAIFYILFLFSLISTFPHIKETSYGINSFGFFGIQAFIHSLYILFAYIFSICFYLRKENSVWYSLSQVLFIVSTIMIFLTLFLIVSFLPYDVLPYGWLN